MKKGGENYKHVLYLKYMIYDLLIVFQPFFMTVRSEIVALTTSRIYLPIY